MSIVWLVTHEPMTPAQSVGRRIRILRESRGMTQATLAAMVNVTQPTLSQWETGAKIARLSTQFRLADALMTTRGLLFREIVLEETAA